MFDGFEVGNGRPTDPKLQAGLPGRLPWKPSAVTVKVGRVALVSNFGAEVMSGGSAWSTSQVLLRRKKK